MADHTGIEWTDATWNPIVGCSIVSPGCTNCYAMKQAARLLDGNPNAPHYAGTTRKVNGQAVWTGKVALAPEHILTQPLRWKRPRKIFVNSMGDLFHEDVPDEWIDRVFAIMALAPQHTFQVLTKRSARMRSYVNSCPQERIADLVFERAQTPVASAFEASKIASASVSIWPLPNVWLGVSAEDQKRAIERIPDLLHTPAAIRFVSAEPLLGPLDLRDLDTGDGTYDALHAPIWEEEWTNWKDTEPTIEEAEESFKDWYGLAEMPTGPMYRPIDWVIAGGESGPRARPMHPAWARRLRDQCTEAGVAFHFKQWGEWADADMISSEELESFDAQGITCDGVVRIGKKRAGRLLDGREHNAFPGSAA